MTPTKRERVIKIRVTAEELARLKGLSGDERLAESIRQAEAAVDELVSKLVNA